MHAGETFTNVSKRRKDRYIEGSVMPDGDESIGSRRARSNWIRRPMMTDFEGRPTVHGSFPAAPGRISTPLYRPFLLFWDLLERRMLCRAHGNGNAGDRCVSLASPVYTVFLLDRIAIEWPLREIIDESVGRREDWSLEFSSRDGQRNIGDGIFVSSDCESNLTVDRCWLIYYDEMVINYRCYY